MQLSFIPGFAWVIVKSLICSAFIVFVSAAHADVAEDQAYLDKWFESQATKSLALDPKTKVHNLKFAHPAPPASLLPPVFQRSFDLLNQVTQGKLVIKQYGGGTLFGFKGGFKAIKAGVADGGMCYSTNEKKGFELTQFMHMPTVPGDNPIMGVRILHELAPKYFAPEFERRGVHLGYIAQFRPFALMSKTPVSSPADLKGKKVISFTQIPGFAKAVGFVELKVPFPEVYTALQQGLADAVIWSDMGFIPFKIYEQAKYYTAIQGPVPTLESCLNRRSFKALPSAIKPLYAHSQQVLSLALAQRGELFHSQAEALYQQHQVNVVTADMAAWQRVYDAMKAAWLDICEKAGKDCRALERDIQRLTDKYQGYSNQQLMQLVLEQPVDGIIKF